MTPEEEQYFQAMQKQVENTKNESQEIQKTVSTMFRKEQDINLVKWQLDINEELENIEHLLRGHIPRVDKEGNSYYELPPEEERILNERGINEILKQLKWYLNKNLILSNFTEDEINIRVKQFAEELTNFIFINYENFGMDTPDKIKYYPITVINIVNAVEAAYHRSLNGGERTSLRTARTVHQSEPLGQNYGMPQQLTQQKKFSMLRPSTWTKI